MRSKKLRKMDGVTEALVTYGLWDIIVRIETPSLCKLDALITETRKIPEVVQTSTLVGT